MARVNAKSIALYPLVMLAGTLPAFLFGQPDLTFKYAPAAYPDAPFEDRGKMFPPARSRQTSTGPRPPCGSPPGRSRSPAGQQPGPSGTGGTTSASCGPASHCSGPCTPPASAPDSARGWTSTAFSPYTSVH